MSPGLALRQVGSRESSEDGFRRAGLAWREPGWTVSRWARIAQAEPGPVPVPAPGSRRGDMELRKSAPVSAGLGPARASPGSARESSWARARPSSHPAPLRPGSRDRRATREIMPLADVLAGRPTISTPALAGRVMIPRPGRSPPSTAPAPTRVSPTIPRPGRSPRPGAAVRTRSATGTGSPPPSVRPTRTSAPAPARGPPHGHGDESGLGATSGTTGPRTRTGTATRRATTPPGAAWPRTAGTATSLA